MILQLLVMIVLMVSTASAAPRASSVYSEEHAREILGLQSGATSPDDIRSAYKSAVKRFHPDANTTESSAAKFNEAQEAYDVLNGKLAPGIDPTGARGGGGGGGGAQEDDYYQYTSGDGERRWKPTGDVSPEDPFVKRFRLRVEAEGGMGEEATFTKVVKAKFEKSVAQFEQQVMRGKLNEAVTTFMDAEKAMPPAEVKISRDILFHLIGERSRRSTREGDQLLKTLVEKMGVANLEDVISLNRELAMLNGVYGDLPQKFPETTKYILGHPDFTKLSYHANRVLGVQFMRDGDLKKYPRFYEEIAQKSPPVRAQLERRRVDMMFQVNYRPLPENEFRTHLTSLLENLRKHGPEMDVVRLRLMLQLMHTDRDLATLQPAIDEVMKVKDYSTEDVYNYLKGFGKGSPKEQLARRKLLGDFLDKMVKDDPSEALKMRDGIVEALRKWGPGGWEDAIAFLNFHLHDQGGLEMSAEYRLLAKKCAELYAKTAANKGR